MYPHVPVGILSYSPFVFYNSYCFFLYFINKCTLYYIGISSRKYIFEIVESEQVIFQEKKLFYAFVCHMI